MAAICQEIKKLTHRLELPQTPIWAFLVVNTPYYGNKVQSKGKSANLLSKSAGFSVTPRQNRCQIMLKATLLSRKMQNHLIFQFKGAKILNEYINRLISFIFSNSRSA